MCVQGLTGNDGWMRVDSIAWVCATAFRKDQQRLFKVSKERCTLVPYENKHIISFIHIKGNLHQSQWYTRYYSLHCKHPCLVFASPFSFFKLFIRLLILHQKLKLHVVWGKVVWGRVMASSQKQNMRTFKQRPEPARSLWSLEYWYLKNCKSTGLWIKPETL